MNSQLRQEDEVNGSSEATVARFEHDGTAYEIDDLGIGWPNQEGMFAIYRGQVQEAEFLFDGPSGDSKALIDQARAALRELAAGGSETGGN